LHSLSTHCPATQTYTLSLHDALPISGRSVSLAHCVTWRCSSLPERRHHSMDFAANVKDTSGYRTSPPLTCDSYRTYRTAIVIGRDRKSTRLNSSHGSISYAVFCLNKT